MMNNIIWPLLIRGSYFASLNFENSSYDNAVNLGWFTSSTYKCLKYNMGHFTYLVHIANP